MNGENAKKNLLYTITLFWLLIVAGCGGGLHRMYSGPELPQDEVCFLVKPKIISITSLDKQLAKTALLTKETVSLNPSVAPWVETTVELLPGPHNLTVNFIYTDYQSPSYYYYDYTSGYSYATYPIYRSEKDVSLTFEGVAGQIYAIRPDSAGIQNFCLRGKKKWHRDWFGTRHVTDWQPRIEDITNSEYANEKILPLIRKNKHKAQLN